MSEPTPTPKRYQTFQEFWPYYLSEHSKPKTKWIHFFGTTLAVTMLIVVCVTQNLWFLPVMFVGGYAPAWYAHFFEEHNRPATFTYPFWSLAADFKMWFLMLTGKIKG